MRENDDWLSMYFLFNAINDYIVGQSSTHFTDGSSTWEPGKGSYVEDIVPASLSALSLGITTPPLNQIHQSEKLPKCYFVRRHENCDAEKQETTIDFVPWAVLRYGSVTSYLV